ncbi:MAG: alpha-glucosidase [Lachnospiraceae bacterium]|nr:alpha-glucosidase [Lachnospiraceae bacterium]
MKQELKKTGRAWWKEAVFYEIYPRSFYDANGDGRGDIRGITQKLSYLRDLGVTALWICPFYRSPMRDNGYDISDYYAINPEFGTLEDVDELLARAKENGIRVILDLVINHTSDQHRWFREACADKNSKYRDYYIFRDDIRGLSNFRSCFGGSTWTQIADGSWYFHSFAKEQPDLNWENPALRRELYDMINWWLARGISGFRLDAITYIKKDPSFPPVEPDGPDGLCDVAEHCLNVPGIEKYLSELRRETFGSGDYVTVAEAPGVSGEQLKSYVGEDGYFSMIFDFTYSEPDAVPGGVWARQKTWDIPELREKIFHHQRLAQEAGWTPVYLENHDQPRSINKYFPGEDIETWSDKMAKALATLFLLLRGTPFLYQGQELGLRNTVFSDISEVDDIHSRGRYERCLQEGYTEAEALDAVNRKSRDQARLPMQWNGGENFGFSGAKPWLVCNRNCEKLTVEDELGDEDSILSYYKKLIRLRNHSEYSDILIYGDFEEVPSADEVICYKRTAAGSVGSENIGKTGNSLVDRMVDIVKGQELYIAVNMCSRTVDFDVSGQIILSNYDANPAAQNSPYSYESLQEELYHVPVSGGNVSVQKKETEDGIRGKLRPFEAVVLKRE